MLYSLGWYIVSGYVPNNKDKYHSPVYSKVRCSICSGKLSCQDQLLAIATRSILTKRLNVEHTKNIYWNAGGLFFSNILSMLYSEDELFKIYLENVDYYNFVGINAICIQLYMKSCPELDRSQSLDLAMKLYAPTLKQNSKLGLKFIKKIEEQCFDR